MIEKLSMFGSRKRLLAPISCRQNQPSAYTSTRNIHDFVGDPISTTRPSSTIKKREDCRQIYSINSFEEWEHKFLTTKQELASSTLDVQNEKKNKMYIHEAISTIFLIHPPPGHKNKRIQDPKLWIREIRNILTSSTRRISYKWTLSRSKKKYVQNTWVPTECSKYPFSSQSPVTGPVNSFSTIFWKRNFLPDGTDEFSTWIWSSTE